MVPLGLKVTMTAFSPFGGEEWIVSVEWFLDYLEDDLRHPINKVEFWGSSRFNYFEVN